jgi:hypothetical protein
MTRYAVSLMAVAVIVLSMVVVACGGSKEDPAATSTGVTSAAGDAVVESASDGHTAPPSTAAAEFHDEMRKLWEDHVTWTRLFIVSAVAELPDASATTERLLRNQTDIGDAIKPFYGDDAGNQLTVLLNEHITTAAALLDAAKTGDSAAVSTASESWYDNADRIAEFLNGADPNNWPEAEMKAMMREHLDLTLEEATAHLTGDYAADIAAYDKIHVQILEMADMLSAGIVDRFPEEFD